MVDQDTTIFSNPIEILDIKNIPLIESIFYNIYIVMFHLGVFHVLLDGIQTVIIKYYDQENLILYYLDNNSEIKRTRKIRFPVSSKELSIELLKFAFFEE